MIIKQILTEPKNEVKWYFDIIEDLVSVYIRSRLRGTFCLRLQHSTSTSWWLGGLLVERRTSVSQIRGSIPGQVAAV